MSEDFPGFIEDDKPKAPKAAPNPPRPSTPVVAGKTSNPIRPAVRPAAAAPAKPVAAAKLARPPSPPADMPGFIEDEEPADKESGGDEADPPFDPFAGTGSPPGTPSADAEPEAEVKPGMRKDLWSCPHCGSRNRPDRNTCRNCSKSPDEEVERLWHQEPKNRKMIGGGIGGVVMLIILVSLVGGGLKLKPAGPDAVDNSPRISGSSSLRFDLGNDRTFVGAKHFAVSGRVIAAQETAGETFIILALGNDAKSEERFKEFNADFSSGDPVVRPEPDRYVILYATFVEEDRPNLAAGQWLSVLGVKGMVQSPGDPRELSRFAYAVRIEKFTQ